ncbi:MAG: hypothetical protein M3Q29_04385 [Chloroflexota bacterium]|nr:hypothetical protein [Chloroflexota bacterium]
MLGLGALGFVLGLRHGIDWDHIAAITDITGSVVTTDEADIGGESHHGFVLATMYALGHASLVVTLGILAIWLGAILPDWVDPILARVVGVTLLLLGFWIFYSLWRYGKSFQLRSRWMLVFSLVGRGWAALKGRHGHAREVTQYGKKTAYGIGVIHGIGAETGSQAVLLAAAAGTTTRVTGSLLLLFFTVGLVVSNSLVAAFSLLGFVSASTKRNIYVAVGVLTAVFSIIVGASFVMGQEARLPSLEGVLNFFFGDLSVDI